MGGAAGVGGLAALGYLPGADDADAGKTSVILGSSASAVSSETASGNSGGSLTAAEIYDLGTQSCVGINTEITTNVFGQIVSNSVSGSGFIISADGYIVTNYHVISDAVQGGYDITVILNDGKAFLPKL